MSRQRVPLFYVLMFVTFFLVGCGGSAPDAYDYVEKSTIHGPSDGIASLAFSPDGSLLAYGNFADNFVYLLDVATGEEIKTLEGHTAAVTSLAFSPNGQLLASTGTVSLPPNTDGTVRIWDVETGEQLAVFETPGIRQLAFSPDDTLLAGAGTGDPVQVILWDVETLSEKRILNGVFNNLAFSPDGTLLASGSRDELVHVLDVATGKEVLSLSGHKGQVSTTVFNPKGELLVSGSDDKIIQLWDAKTGKILKSLTGHESAVGFVAFSPDESVLASLGSGVNVTREGGQISIGISSKDRVVRFWNIETGEQIGLIEIAEGVSSVSFNSDWTRIATGSSDGIIRLWGVKE